MGLDAISAVKKVGHGHHHTGAIGSVNQISAAKAALAAARPKAPISGFAPNLGVGIPKAEVANLGAKLLKGEVQPPQLAAAATSQAPVSKTPDFGALTLATRGDDNGLNKKYFSGKKVNAAAKTSSFVA